MMSWSASFRVVPGEELQDVYESNVDVPEHAEQYRAAKVAVFDILNSGALGGHQHKVVVVGHGNPGHEPAPGWANDGVTITIVQVPDEDN